MSKIQYKKSIFSRKKDAEKEKRLVFVPTSRILPNPACARRSFTDLTRLADSIRRYGILQPLTVRPIESNELQKKHRRDEAAVYELISGERRLRAAKIVGLNEVPCICIDVNDRIAAELTVAENSGRVSLGFFEEASAMESLIDVYGLTHDETARVFGIPKSAVSAKLRLLRLTPAEKFIISGSGISEQHAKALLKICDSEKRIDVLQEAIRLGLSVAQTEELVDRVVCPAEEKPQKKRKVSIKDPRVVYNTIDKAIESIENAGIAVEKERKESSDTVELRFKIKKTTAPVALHSDKTIPKEVITNPKAV